MDDINQYKSFLYVDETYGIWLFQNLNTMKIYIVHSTSRRNAPSSCLFSYRWAAHVSLTYLGNTNERYLLIRM